MHFGPGPHLKDAQRVFLQREEAVLVAKPCKLRCIFSSTIGSAGAKQAAATQSMPPAYYDMHASREASWAE